MLDTCGSTVYSGRGNTCSPRENTKTGTKLDPQRTESTRLCIEWWASQILLPRRIRSEMLSRSAAKPTKGGLAESKRLLRYLCSTCELGLKLPVDNEACNTFTVFSDSDRASAQPARQTASSWVNTVDGALTTAQAATQSVLCHCARQSTLRQQGLPVKESASRNVSWLAEKQRTSILILTAQELSEWPADVVCKSSTSGSAIPVAAS